MIISKTRYQRGIGCERILWLDVHMPEAAEAEEDLSRARQGTLVGELARDLYGPHETIPYSQDKSLMIRMTDDLLEKGTPVICEASFSCDNAFCSVDLLINHGNGHVDIVEVKSSGELKPEYIDDAAFQTRVLIRNRLIVDRVYIAFINKAYIRQGDLDIQQLFIQQDVTEEVKQKLPEVDENLCRFLTVLCSPEEPVMEFGADCPECTYWKHCSRDLPHPNVFDLPGASGFNKNHKLKLYQQGCVAYEDLKDRPELKDRQKATVHGALLGETRTDQEHIREFLQRLSFPLYFLDFESFNPAVPPYDDTRPYQQISFQYSLHWLETPDGILHHSEFLGDPETSPSRPLAEQLSRDIPKDVCVTAYNMSFEKTVIKQLADQFPDLADHLLNIRDHIQDLMIPFSKLHWYLPAMQGSYSIKYVLPALYPDDPELDYHNLEEIHKGTEASEAFVMMAEMTPEERQRTRTNLLKYCGLDTLAMVRVWEALVKAVEDEGIS